MKFSEQLINWYKANKRDLPWRKTIDPYTIWLSEIILQQTRVNQGIDYFYKFIEHYPNVKDLAQATEEDVLKLWQGLGYYSRARNLHYTAKYITKNYNGKFPENHKEILQLKGVGEYTASAIASFAYNQPYPVVDGNVYRVLSRIFGIDTPIDSTQGKKEFNLLAQDLLDKKNPATHNQAIMEFGALQCTPKSPNCIDCPFKLECYAIKNNSIEKLPIKSKKIKQKTRYLNYLVINSEGTTYMNKRSKNDIWKGLYDFPLIETNKEITSFEELTKSFSELLHSPFTLISKSKKYQHILSHQKLNATFWNVKTTDLQSINLKYTKIDIDNINNYPVPKLIENYLKATF